MKPSKAIETFVFGGEPLESDATPASAAVPCSVAVLTSEPQHDGGFVPVLHVDHQSFSFGMQVETEAESDWYCSQMRTALERAGCRVRPQNAQTEPRHE